VVVQLRRRTAANGQVISDSIASAPAVVTGSGGMVTGTALGLPGSSGIMTPGNLPATAPAGSPAIRAYIDLPNGIISSKTNLTVEIWATPVSAQSNQLCSTSGA